MCFVCLTSNLVVDNCTGGLPTWVTYIHNFTPCICAVHSRMITVVQIKRC